MPQPKSPLLFVHIPLCSGCTLTVLYSVQVWITEHVYKCFVCVVCVYVPYECILSVEFVLFLMSPDTVCPQYACISHSFLNKGFSELLEVFVSAEVAVFGLTKSLKWVSQREGEKQMASLLLPSVTLKICIVTRRNGANKASDGRHPWCWRVRLCQPLP